MHEKLLSILQCSTKMAIRRGGGCEREPIITFNKLRSTSFLFPCELAAGAAGSDFTALALWVGGAGDDMGWGFSFKVSRGCVVGAVGAPGGGGGAEGCSTAQFVKESLKASYWLYC
jgi:hypothetical protein